MNLPNKLTLLRVAMIPACLVLLGMGYDLAAAIVFALAAFTDFLDGHIARKQGIVTNFGKFADPVADKILVLSVMILLTAMGRLPAWAVCVVAARELAVDGLRLIAAEQRVVIAAGWLGKIKTNAQFLCVLCALLSLPAWLVGALTAIMAVMTVWSGADYFWKARGLFGGGEK